MHICPDCGDMCDCDGEDVGGQPAPLDCNHCEAAVDTLDYLDGYRDDDDRDDVDGWHKWQRDE